MSIKDYHKLPLSELSLMALNAKMTDLVAIKEIKRRFENNGCDYDNFIEEEQIVLNKRGKDPKNYLLWDGVTAQQVMETYFNIVYGETMPCTLFSEVQLCNNDPRGTFFDRVLALEINNLQQRIEKTSMNSDCEKLKFIRDILQKQRAEKGLWYENAGTDAVYNICPNLFNDNEKKEKRVEKLNNKIDAGSKMALFRLYTMLIFEHSSLFEYPGIHKFLLADSMRLNRQKVKILSDLKYGKPVDYSFVDTDALIKRKQRIFL